MTVVTASQRSKGAAQRDDRGRPDIVPVLFHPGDPRVGVVVHVGLLALPGVDRPLPQPRDGVLTPLHRVGASSPTASTSCSAADRWGSSANRVRKRPMRSSARWVARASTAATPARTSSSPSTSSARSGSSASTARSQAAGQAAGAVRASFPARARTASVSRICVRTLTATAGSRTASTRNGSTSGAAGDTELPSPQHAKWRVAWASSAVRRSGDQSRSSRSGPYCPSGRGYRGRPPSSSRPPRRTGPSAPHSHPRTDPHPHPHPHPRAPCPSCRPPFRFDFPKLKP